MKPVFFKAIRWVGTRALSLLFLSGLVLSPLAAEATQVLWSNNGTISSPTNIDATSFLNTGVFNWGFATLTPFQTAHTLNYTNKGTMIGSDGWEFDFGPLANGGRGWSANFFNDNYNSANNTGLIQAPDGFIVTYLLGLAPQSLLWVSATNIINKGLLEAGAAGEIKLIGQNVLLSRSELEISPIVSAGSSNGRTNFISDTAIYDEYWQQTNAAFDSRSIWFVVGTNISFNPITMTFTTNVIGDAESPGFTAFTCGGAIGTRVGPFTPDVVGSVDTTPGILPVMITNMDQSTSTVFIPTNIVHQAVFVSLGDPNITAQIHFSPSGNPTNFYDTVAIRFAMTSTNFTTLALETNTLFLVDNLASAGGLASATNGGLAANSVINPNATCTAPTARPGNYVLSRSDTGDFAGGRSSTNGTPPGDFFFGLDAPEMPTNAFAFFTNNTAFSRYAAYSALVDNLAAEPPASGLGANITNAPGRIRIYAHDLDLSKTRMRAEAEIVIQASNLISSAGAVLDCQNLSYNLGSTNGFLNITNLASPIVTRLQGTISMWSAAWINQATVVVTSYDTNGSPVLLTNFANVNYAATIVDASGLSSTVPVTVQDLILHSTNMVVSDTMNVVHSLLLDGKSFTLQGSLSLSGFVQSWTHANAPTLRYFTNNPSGLLSIPNDAHFGDDGPTNYAAFVNRGVIQSGGQTINSDYLEISNGAVNETFSGAFVVFCKTGLLANASIFSANGIQFYANSLTIDPSIVSTTDSLNFNVTNLLTDGGIPGNNFTCENGFNLFIKPTLGDLLGSTITDVAFGQDEVDHVWAGTDFNATASGYLNNVAVGKLVLDPISTVFEPLFFFGGTGAHNGLYVSNLDLSMLTDFTNEIAIDPTLTIYFAKVSFNPNVNTNGFSSAEAYLDNNTNLFGSRLQWVQGFASSTVAQPSTFTKKFQLTADFNNSGGQFQVLENIMPAQTNVTEASSDLVHWVPIYTNIGSYSNFGPTVISDPAATNYPSRYYRFKILQ
jgi:hypothetical protein